MVGAVAYHIISAPLSSEGLKVDDVLQSLSPLGNANATIYVPMSLVSFFYTDMLARSLRYRHDFGEMYPLATRVCFSLTARSEKTLVDHWGGNRPSPCWAF